MSDQQEEFLAAMEAALSAEATPSAFAADLRSAGVAVVQHPRPATPAAPVVPAVPQGGAPPPPAGAPPAELALSEDDAARLAEARVTAQAVDPRVAFRESAAARLVAEKGMPEALARSFANTSKKADLEAFLGPPPAVGSPVPPQGQAPRAPLQVPAQGAAQVAGQQSQTDPQYAELRAEVAALRAEQHGNRAQSFLTEFTAAAAELRGTFPRLVSQDGKTLDSHVAQVATGLLGLPSYKDASPKQLLHAAAAAVFAAESRAAPVNPTTRTPVLANVTGDQRKPLSDADRAVLIVELRAHHGKGDPRYLSAAQQAAVDADFARIVAARS